MKDHLDRRAGRRNERQPDAEPRSARDPVIGDGDGTREVMGGRRGKDLSVAAEHVHVNVGVVNFAVAKAVVQSARHVGASRSVGLGVCGKNLSRRHWKRLYRHHIFAGVVHESLHEIEQTVGSLRFVPNIGAPCQRLAEESAKRNHPTNPPGRGRSRPADLFKSVRHPFLPTRKSRESLKLFLPTPPFFSRCIDEQPKKYFEGLSEFCRLYG